MRWIWYSEGGSDTHTHTHTHEYTQYSSEWPYGLCAEKPTHDKHHSARSYFCSVSTFKCFQKDRVKLGRMEPADTQYSMKGMCWHNTSSVLESRMPWNRLCDRLHIHTPHQWGPDFLWWVRRREMESEIGWHFKMATSDLAAIWLGGTTVSLQWFSVSIFKLLLGTFSALGLVHFF